MATVIGIDLDTTNFCVAAIGGKTSHVTEYAEGIRTKLFDARVDLTASALAVKGRPFISEYQSEPNRLSA